MLSIPFYLGGEFHKNENLLEVINPFSKELVMVTYKAGSDEINLAIERAQKAQPALHALPVYKRAAVLNVIAYEIESKKVELGKVLAAEAGKPLFYAVGEVERAAQTFRIAAEECKRLPKEYLSLDWTPAGERKEGLVKYFPVGIVAGIVPFNFPLNLAVHKIAPAIAAGCPIILKPASSTPLSCLKLAEIIDKTELPKGSLSILPMDRVAGNQLVTDQRIKLLSFTGSPEVGWNMKSKAGKKKVVLELGGNAGVIVCDTANVDLAAKRCVDGGFAYSGQVCIHTQRIFVHKAIFDKFANTFIKATQALEFGDPLDNNTKFSSMIDEENAVRVENWVNEAVTDGAKILLGGKRSGAFYPPTVLTDTKADMKVCELEVFGPVVSLEPYSDFHTAVENINKSRFGLQAGIFTNSIDEMDYAFENIEAGGIMVNEVPTFRVDHMPYGGIKDSGLGREGVKYAIHDMMEAKILVKNY